MLNTFIGSMEPRLVFFPIKGEDATPASLGLPYQPLTLTTSDGERIAAWQLEPPEPRADIVYFHGNGGNLSGWLPVFAALHRLGYRVLAVDYRGYGSSTGSPTEEGIYLDGEAAVRHAHAGRPRPDSAKPRPLVFWGRSLGATVAAAAARVVTPDGLVLESGFPDKASIVRTQPMLRVMNLFASYRFPTVELLRDFRKPVLVIHGDADTIIPVTLGRELFDGLSAPKQFLTIPGADHNDFFEIGDRRYWPAVTQFLERLR